MRDLTRDVANHDDATSADHAIDKQEAEERRRYDYQRSLSLARDAGSQGILKGTFLAPTLGFSFIMRGKVRRAEQMDGAAYTKLVLAIAKPCVGKRQRQRAGKWITDSQPLKSGAVSLVTTTPPWAVDALQALPSGLLQELLLELATAQARAIEEKTGRSVIGGGVHLDTKVPHFHIHVSKLGPDGEVMPKANFNSLGPWTCGAWRIEREFPGLLTPDKLEMLKANLARKEGRICADKVATEAIDDCLARFFARDSKRALILEKSKQAYRVKKARAQKSEPWIPLVRAAMGSIARGNPWPIARQFMSIAVWRLIPKDVRPAVRQSLRVFQTTTALAAAVARTSRAMPLPAYHRIATGLPELSIK